MPHTNAVPRPPPIKPMPRILAMSYALFSPNKLVNYNMQRVINNDFGLLVPFEIFGNIKHSWRDRIRIFTGCWFKYKAYISYMDKCTHEAYLNRFVIRPLEVYMESELSDKESDE